jgi:hypothetical protein
MMGPEIQKTVCQAGSSERLAPLSYEKKELSEAGKNSIMKI